MANQNIYLGSGPKDPNLKRSKYDMSFTNHMSAKFGPIYPHFLMEMNPDESLRIRDTAEFDFMPMYFPLQSRITMHISYFKCAFRNLWKNYKDVVSRVGSHVWPYVSRSYNWHQTSSLADYMGICSYSNTDVLGWSTLTAFTSNDPNVTALQRSYLTSTSPLVSISNSLNSFFTTNPTSASPGSDVYCSVLTKFCDLPIAPSQPYFKLSLLTSDNTLPSKLPDIFFGIVSFSSNPHSENSYKRYFIDIPCTAVMSLASDYQSVQRNTYQLIESKQVSVSPGTNAYLHTFLCNLPDNFVKTFNTLFDDGYKLRIFVAYKRDAPGASSFGYEYTPIMKPDVAISSSTGTLLRGASYSSQNGGYSLNGLYSLLSSGLQSNFVIRVKNVENVDTSSSPFVVADGASSPQIPLSVLPFRMYQFIYNLYFRNQQIDPFIKNGQPTYNDYLSYDGDGADTLTPLDFNLCQWEKDIFTTAKYTPQTGNAPLVGISHTPGASEAVFHFVDENDQPITLKVATSSNGRLQGIDEYSNNANESTLKNLNALIQYGISINDFRSVSAFQRYLERNQRAGFDYKSIVKEFFGTNAPIGEEFPEYIGGFSRPVNIYKLENQSAAGDVPLGYFAGVGRAAGSNKPWIKCFCSERSYIMGLVWFSVTPVYPQHLPKHWTKHELLDFYNPAFATIGNQPIYNYEVAPLQASSQEELMGVFGYQRPWYDYTMKFDEVHGQFRSTQHNYLIQREFQNVPQLGKQFIEIKNDDLTNVFSYTEGSDKIYGAIRHDVVYNSVVPKFIEPKIIG